jgi:hypothetical protein
MPLTDEQIKDLYSDPSFPGAFSGMANMRHFIEQVYNENISLNRLYRVIKTVPEYIYQIRPKKKYPLRSYQVDGFAQLMGEFKIFFRKILPRERLLNKKSLFILIFNNNFLTSKL